METVRFGRSGLRVSELALGTWRFGRDTDEAASFAQLDLFRDRGGNFVDTADVYGNGLAEEIVGRWLASRGGRDELVIGTKVWGRMGPGPNALGLSRKHIVAAIDASLRRLQTDHVDLYYVHAWDPGVELEETLSTLDGLVRAGKVRHLGASNWLGWQLMHAWGLARIHGWEPFVCVQNEYNLLSRMCDLEVLPACHATGLVLTPWSPLGGGWLTGKYRRGVSAPIAGTRVADWLEAWQPDSWEHRGSERTWAVVDALLGIAEARGVSPAEVALNWLRAKPGIVAPIVGARTVEQLEGNLRATGWELEPAEVVELDEASGVALASVYAFVDAMERTQGRQGDQPREGT
jgi:aryl-alcohol dehydrogenase-like predicted oxidoreductase